MLPSTLKAKPQDRCKERSNHTDSLVFIQTVCPRSGRSPATEFHRIKSATPSEQSIESLELVFTRNQISHPLTRILNGISTLTYPLVIRGHKPTTQSEQSFEWDTHTVSHTVIQSIHVYTIICIEYHRII